VEPEVGGEMTDRLSALLDFLKEDPDDPFTRFAVAQEYARRGDTASARAYYERLVQDHPTYVGTYYHLGKLHEAEGRREDAEGIYEAGVRTANELSDFHARAELQDALMSLRGIGWDD
jgi:tetratricopeptide (TPR) repeat protein